MPTFITVPGAPSIGHHDSTYVLPIGDAPGGSSSVTADSATITADSATVTADAG